jgi:hypothetical protein
MSLYEEVGNFGPEKVFFGSTSTAKFGFTLTSFSLHFTSDLPTIQRSG